MPVCGCPVGSRAYGSAQVASAVARDWPPARCAQGGGMRSGHPEALGPTIFAIFEEALHITPVAIAERLGAAPGEGFPPSTVHHPSSGPCRAQTLFEAQRDVNRDTPIFPDENEPPGRRRSGPDGQCQTQLRVGADGSPAASTGDPTAALVHHDLRRGPQAWGAAAVIMDGPVTARSSAPMSGEFSSPRCAPAMWSSRAASAANQGAAIRGRSGGGRGPAVRAAGI